ncbi:MAG: hypothetical protein DHS20C14_11430 [Phycisphaeraceae bacterium]|nr:MAG: hypothetical protein DHS20C14_11430 [Phycisphaeraceae bacterium]
MNLRPKPPAKPTPKASAKGAPKLNSKPGTVWMRAAAFAAREHKGHLRKDGRTPYIAHVFRVAMIVSHQFGHDDESTLAAAILHDVIEDTPNDYDDISRRFGHDVADMVAALTKNMLLPEPEREKDYDQRLAKADWRARLIKLADVLDNATDGAGKAGKLRDKCRRAIALATPDAANHPETRAGIELVRALPILAG